MTTNSMVSPHLSMAERNLLSIEEVEERIQQLLMENADLRSTLQQNNTYMRQLSITLVEWQKEVNQVQTDYQDKFEKAKKLVIRLKQENTELKQKLELPTTLNIATPAPIPSTSAPAGLESTSPLSMESYVVISTEPPQALQEQDHEQLPSYESLFESKTVLKPGDPMLIQLQREADTLRLQLNVEMESNQKKQMLLNKTQMQLDQLMLDYEEVRQKLHEKSLIHDKELVAASELEKLQVSNKALSERCTDLEEQIVSLTTRLAKAEELALLKQHQNKELQNQILALESELETLPILKTQVELYQTDFEAERTARQNLAGEKESLAQQNRLLRRQLDAATSRPSSGVSTSASTTMAEHESISNFPCPKCRFNFNSNDSLNNHLDICLSQMMFP